MLKLSIYTLLICLSNIYQLNKQVISFLPIELLVDSSPALKMSEIVAASCNSANTKTQLFCKQT